MGMLSWFRKTPEVAVHDFTYSFTGHSVSMVKPIGDGMRAFIMGEGVVPKPDDIIVVRGKGVPVTSIRYKIENIKSDSSMWQAYARMVQRPRA